MTSCKKKRYSISLIFVVRRTTRSGSPFWSFPKNFYTISFELVYNIEVYVAQRYKKDKAKNGIQEMIDDE